MRIWLAIALLFLSGRAGAQDENRIRFDLPDILAFPAGRSLLLDPSGYAVGARSAGLANGRGDTI